MPYIHIYKPNTSCLNNKFKIKTQYLCVYFGYISNESICTYPLSYKNFFLYVFSFIIANNLKTEFELIFVFLSWSCSIECSSIIEYIYAYIDEHHLWLRVRRGQGDANESTTLLMRALTLKSRLHDNHLNDNDCNAKRKTIYIYIYLYIDCAYCESSFAKNQKKKKWSTVCWPYQRVRCARTDWVTLKYYAMPERQQIQRNKLNQYTIQPNRMPPNSIDKIFKTKSSPVFSV